MPRPWFAVATALAALVACVGDTDSPPDVASRSDDGSPREAPSTVQAEVLAAVDGFIVALGGNDEAASREVMLEEGQYFRVLVQEGEPDILRVPHEEYFARLATTTDRVVLERIWDPTVLVRDPIALVWTPYDLYVDDVFSHCGVDAFFLIRTDDGWRIASITYTVEPEGCEPSPLGPPDDSIPYDLRVVPWENREASGAARDAVLGSVHAFPRALETRDVELARTAMRPDGVTWPTSLGTDGSVQLRVNPNTAFFEWLASTDERHEETMMDEIVLVHDPIAAVLASYEYRIAGERTGCGINAVGLVRTPNGWVTTDWIWTDEPDGCDDSDAASDAAPDPPEPGDSIL